MTAPHVTVINPLALPVLRPEVESWPPGAPEQAAGTDRALERSGDHLIYEGVRRMLIYRLMWSRLIYFPTGLKASTSSRTVTTEVELLDECGRELNECGLRAILRIPWTAPLR